MRYNYLFSFQKRSALRGFAEASKNLKVKYYTSENNFVLDRDITVFFLCKISCLKKFTLTHLATILLPQCVIFNF